MGGAEGEGEAGAGGDAYLSITFHSPPEPSALSGFSTQLG